MPSQDRVKLAQRHEKLRELMIGQVIQRLGRKASEGEKEFISQEVDLMIHRGENSEKLLNQIAHDVRNLTPTAPSQVSAAPTEERLRQHNKAGPSGRAQHGAAAAGSQVPTSVVSAARAADAHVRKLQREKAASTASGAAAAAAGGKHASFTPPDFDDGSAKRSTIRKPQDVHKDDLWAKLAEKEVEEYHRQALEERRKQKKLEAEQRQYLEQQVALRSRKFVDLKKDEEKFVVEEERQRIAWEEEERRKEQEKKKRFAEEKASRDAQLELARQRRAIEEAARKQEDVIAAIKVKEEFEREQELARERRIKAKEEVVKAQAFNKHFEAVRASEKASEKAKDLEHQRMFLERLKKQDEERELALIKMQEKQRHQQQIAFQMQADFSEKAKEDERKAQEHKLRREAEELAREKAAAKKAEDAKVRQRQYLMLQMIEREEAKKKEREAEEALRQRLLADQEEAERREAEKKVLAKKKALEHRKAVEEQIQLSEARSRPVYMSEAEKRLNIPLLKKAHVDV